jgi:hypothetical protein
MAKITQLFPKKNETKVDEPIIPCGKVEGNSRIYCPELHWYLRDNCPFDYNRHECSLYKELCGCIFIHKFPK